MNPQIRRFEELTVNAFPALQTELFDGWVLRFSDGFSYRANCICPLYPSEINLENKIRLCEQKYAAKGLPVVFKMTENTRDLDGILEQRGFSIAKSVDLMSAAIPPDSDAHCLNGVEVSEKIDEEWLNAAVCFSDIHHKAMQNIQKRILRKIAGRTVFVKVRQDKRVVGCGLGVLDGGSIGLYDIRVDENHRRSGFGTRICRTILQAGKAANGMEAYLQVSCENHKAISLYQKLGFHVLYHYWFRVKRTDNCVDIID
ncbi:MAG: GNAT family N-acetyltransferase [bacterium]